jgi:hypothetical protein
MLYNIKVRFLNGLKVQACLFMVLIMFILIKIVYLRDLCQYTQESVKKGLIIQVKPRSESLLIEDFQFYKSFGF